ncbi:MAG: fused DSP-PTPase phosphatase/NAD kinase-like protein [Phycisphaerales bacterium]
MKHRNPLITIFTVTLLACGLGFGFRYGVRDDLFARNFGVVEEGKVYRSGRQTPAMMKRLVEEHKIKTIVDLGAFGDGSVEEKQAQATAAALGVRRVRYVLAGDGTGDPNAYVAALRVMVDAASQPVLVHCAAGAQRTSGCVMLYRLATAGEPFEKTYAEAQEYKHRPSRNPNLLPYLQQWGDKIVDALAAGTEKGAARIPYTPPNDGVNHNGVN